MKQLLVFKGDEVVESKTDENEEEKAAVKIQASYRGYKTRASLKTESLVNDGKSDANEEDKEADKEADGIKQETEESKE